MWKVQNALSRAAVALFCACYLWIFLQIWLFNSSFSYSPLLQLMLMACWCACAGTLWIAAERTGLMERLCVHRRRILFAALAVLFLIQLYVGIYTRQTPIFDYGKLVNGAMIWADEGNSAAFESHRAYLHLWTNNMGEFALLGLVFRALRIVGFTDYYAAMVAMGHLCFTAAVACTFLYAERAFGARAALGTLFLWFTYPVVYAQSSAAYTDTFSIWAAPTALCLWERGKSSKFRLLWICGAALAAAVGGQIKGTAWIILVALVLECAVTETPKRMMSALCAVLAVAFAVSAVCGVLYRAMTWDDERLERESMPIAFWFMMGLSQPDGAYHGGDAELVLEGETKEQRTQIALDEAERRLREMGWKTYLVLLQHKTTRTFGCGNGEIQYMFGRDPVYPDHFLYELLLDTRAGYRIADKLVQCEYLMFYPLAIAAAAYALKAQVSSAVRHCAPYLSLVGFYCFMLLWESNHRQIVNQWPLFILLAALFFELCVPKIAKSRYKLIKKKEKICAKR